MKTMDIDQWKESIREPWFVQGFNGVPFYLNPVAVRSGLDLWEEVDTGYTQFFIVYKDRYGEYGYDSTDFEKMWSVLYERIQNDPEYLPVLERTYYARFDTATAQISRVLRELDSLSDEQLVGALKQAGDYMTISAGVAHIVEALSYGLESRVHTLLKQEIADEKKYKEYLHRAVAPVALSFVAREDAELRSLKALQGDELTQKLQKHIDQWHWVRNSYAGKGVMTLELLQERLDSLTDEIEGDEYIHEEEMSQWSTELQEVIHLIQTTTKWQDDRKANILRSIGVASTVLSEVAKRTGIEQATLEHMSVVDLESIQTLEDIVALKDELEQREQGVMFYATREGEQLLYGNEFAEAYEAWNTRSEVSEEMEIRGSIANTGTATGPVRICMKVADIVSVEKGDILVTSMTRPEFMPALKKAAAIVTDEGGITSHAAIVSRELGIPAIIGTKIATKVLKDGMQVEVRANHGFVRIIEE